MKNVYVAGPISATDSLKFLDNIHRGIELSREVLFHGHAPFCPFLDFQFLLTGERRTNFTLKLLQDYSMAWLEKSDYVLVLPEHERSAGTKAEIDRAKELKIPVLYWNMGFDWKEIK